MVIKKVIVISMIRIIRIIPHIIRIVFPIFLGRYPKKYLSKKFTFLVKLQIQITRCEHFFEKIYFTNNIQLLFCSE